MPDPAHVEAFCEVMHDAYESAAVASGWETNPASRKPWSDVPAANQETMRAAVRAILTSTDPEVHAALLAALVRVGVLGTESGVRPSFCPCGCGDADDIPRRRYVTRWEDVDSGILNL